MRAKAKTAMTNVVTSVVSTLKQLPSKVLSIGGDLVTGLWNGVNNKLSWLKSKIRSFTSSVLSSIKSFFGVHSPSTETAWIGDMLDQGLAKGMLDSIDDPVSAMERVTQGVLGAAETVDGISIDRQISQTTAAAAAQRADNSGLMAKLDTILDALKAGQVLAIDGDALVGATADRYDQELGRRRALAARGAW
jgi:phage-related protein